MIGVFIGNLLLCVCKACKATIPCTCLPETIKQISLVKNESTYIYSLFSAVFVRS